MLARAVPTGHGNDLGGEVSCGEHLDGGEHFLLHPGLGRQVRSHGTDVMLTVVTEGMTVVEQDLHLLPVRVLHRADTIEHEGRHDVVFSKFGRDLHPVAKVGTVVERQQDVERCIFRAVLVLKHTGLHEQVVRGPC